MKSKLTFPKKKRVLLGSVSICVVLIAGLAIWLQSGKVAEAAILNPPSPSLPSGLVGWWRFDEGTGSVANDSSGSGNNGAIFGANRVTGKYGDALQFASGEYVTLGQNGIPVGSSSRTVSAWVYPTAYPASNVMFAFAYGGNSVVGDSFGLGIDPSGQVCVDIFGGRATSYLVVPLDRWSFIAAVYGGGTSITLYLNELIYGGSFAITPNSLDTSTFIGQWEGGGLSWNGMLDEVRVYNRALSTAEIQTDFQMSPGFASQLTAKIPQGTTQVIATLSWQGPGSLNATITSPSQSYTESTIPVYAKTTYSTIGGNSTMLNIKRLSVSVTALPAGQSWTIALSYDSVSNYQISVEIQK